MCSNKPHILTTRPDGQHQAFHARLTSLGFTISHLPCLLIEPVPCTLLDANDLSGQFDAVLFTSANAVSHGHALRALPWPDLAVHAIGPATARNLEQLGQSLSRQPQPPFNSEQCLSTLANVPPGRLLIVKGEGGRTLLHDELQKQGWQVSSAEVYRRTLPPIEPATLEQLFSGASPDIVSVTSNEALCNLVKLVGDYRTVLLRLPLLVNSERAAALARTLNFTGEILVARPAGDDGQLHALQGWITRTC